MATSKELREKRAGIWAQAQEFNTRHAAGEELSAEDQAAWTRALDEVDSLGREIENLERSSSLESTFEAIDHDTVVRNANDEPANASDESKYRKAFDRFIRHGMSDLDVEERQLLRANFVDSETRAQSSGTGNTGGYSVPEGFWAKVTETMALYGGIIEAGAEVVTTESGNPLPWPTVDDTSNTGALLAENAQISAQDIAFGQKTLGAYTYTSKLILASIQFLQDTGIDAEGFIAKKAGERLGRIYNAQYTTGTGSAQPQGLVAAASTGKTTAGATAITYNEIVDLVHSVDAAYRSDNAVFMMHDLILAYVRKIRDDSGGSGLGRPIWEPSVQVGVPDALLGYKVVVNNSMASTVATTNKTMAFGSVHSGFVVRNVAGGQLMRLEERYADYLQVGFFAFGRTDSLLQDASAVKLLVQA